MSFNLRQFKDLLNDYASEQPYEVRCSWCNANLTYNTNVDAELDIFLYVDPCDCQKEK